MQVIYKDFLTEEENIYEIPVTISDEMVFKYHENGAKVKVWKTQLGFRIKREADATTELEFILNKKTRCYVTTVEGQLLFDIYTETLDFHKDRLYIVYYLLNNREIVAHKAIEYVY